MSKRELVIIGAGPGGVFAAIYFAQKGFKVKIFEQRSDPRLEKKDSGRSINISLTTRGISALKAIHVWELVKAIGVPLKGRIIHVHHNKLVYQPYGATEKEIEYSLKRQDFLAVLINYAQCLSNVNIEFNTCCIDLDTKNKVINLKNTSTGGLRSESSDFVIGADGIHSIIRKKILAQSNSHYFNQEELGWEYKELFIPKRQTLSLSPNELHVWTNNQTMIFAFPNLDGSFSCNFSLPTKGQPSFSTLNTISKIDAFFLKNFPDFYALVPDISKQFLDNKIGHFICNTTLPWYCKDVAVLLGDACHATLPFYSQGVSIALEDCLYLGEAIDLFPDDMEKAFDKYQESRKSDTDLLTDLTKQRFFELKSNLATPFYSAKQNTEIWLSKSIPKFYKPLYSFIVHTTMPYKDAVKRYKRQQLIAKCLGIDMLAFIVMIISFFYNWLRIHADYKKLKF